MTSQSRSSSSRPRTFSRRTAFAALSAAWVIAQTLTAETAAAQAQSTNRVLAEALFRDGRQLMEQDKVSEACAKFAESYRLDRALGTLINLALCHEKEGKTASAWSEFSDAAAEATAEKDDRGAFAQKHAAALANELSRVQFTIANPTSELPTLEIQVDKNPLGKGAWTSIIPLDPGEHEIGATADGKKPYHGTFTVPKGAGVTSVTIPVLEDAPVVVAPPPPRSTEQAPNQGSAQRTVGYIVGAVGIVGVGVGTFFGVRALGLKSDRDDACRPEGCTNTGIDADKDARDAATFSTIGFAAGGALLAGGLVLVLTAPSSNSVRVGTTGRAVVLGGTF